jgi:glycosyltransferase involved in cell wall biosynthesis
VRRLKTNNHPLVTVGIPCFNAEDTIRRAVESILSQTWPQREILIVDDTSSDGSGMILEELERTQPEIRVIWHENNRGFPEAANSLLAEAQGEFIAFLGDDDEATPHRLERQYQRIIEYEAAHPDAMVLCYSDRDVVPVGAETPVFQQRGIGRVPPEPSGSAVADYLLGLIKGDGRSWGMVGSGTLMARTDALRRLGGFDTSFRRGADFDLAIRAALSGAHFIGVDAPLITQHVTQTSDKTGNTELLYRLRLVEKHKAYLKQRRSYLGAWCYMHAQFHNGLHWRWRVWYVAALVCFPWSVSRERLRRSSLLGRFGVLRNTGTMVVSRSE